MKITMIAHSEPKVIHSVVAWFDGGAGRRGRIGRIGRTTTGDPALSVAGAGAGARAAGGPVSGKLQASQLSAPGGFSWPQSGQRMVLGLVLRVERRRLGLLMAARYHRARNEPGRAGES
jgi:hypothetical protein